MRFLLVKSFSMSHRVLFSRFGTMAQDHVTSTMARRVRPTLDLIDDLRQIGVQNKVPIPQIVVMGDQSSGKSSVLEAIAGIPFPRGAGLVTRCATQISMSNGSEWKATLQAEGCETITVSKPSEITDAIEALTHKLCGEKTFNADDGIEVRLVAPGAPDLTLIDIPGIVRTVTDGQSESVIDEVSELIEKYLVQPRTIILAVIPCNVDVATVDILERAAKVDPDGNRTMGVLTKPDLVDEGAEASVIGVLSNSTKPLKYGYVMIKNRAQKDLDDDQSLENARLSEHEFFEMSKFKDHEGRHRLGVGALTTALTELLVTQIETALPAISREIDVALQRLEDELDALGPPPPESARSRRAEAASLVRTWAAAMGRITNHADYRGFDAVGELRVLQLENQLHKHFVNSVNETKPDFSADNFRDDMAKHIQEFRGRELPGFLNFSLFTQLIQEYTSMWKEPTQCLLREVSDNLEDASLMLLQKYMSSYPLLIINLEEKLRDHFMNINAGANARLKKLLDQEALPQTQNHYLFDTINKMRNDRMEKMINGYPDISSSNSSKGLISKDAILAMLKSNIGDESNESQEVRDMIDVLAAYWKVAKKRLVYLSGYIDEVIMVVTDVSSAPHRIDDMEESLLNAILVDCDDDELERIFQQSPEKERCRAELNETRKKMELAKRRIKEGVNLDARR